MLLSFSLPEALLKKGFRAVLSAKERGDNERERACCFLSELHRKCDSFKFLCFAALSDDVPSSHKKSFSLPLSLMASTEDVDEKERDRRTPPKSPLAADAKPFVPSAASPLKNAAAEAEDGEDAVKEEEGSEEDSDEGDDREGEEQPVKTFPVFTDNQQQQRSSSRPPSSSMQQQQQQGGKLFIGGIPDGTTVELLREYASEFGALNDVVLMGGRGFAFVTFADPRHAQSFLEVRESRVEECLERAWNCARAGERDEMQKPKLALDLSSFSLERRMLSLAAP